MKTPTDPGLFIAPFQQLIHNIHDWGDSGWSWRCGVVYSRLDPGYVDGACRYDHDADSWEQLLADATEHLRRWHGIYPEPHPDPECPHTSAGGYCNRCALAHHEGEAARLRETLGEKP